MTTVVTIAVTAALSFGAVSAGFAQEAGEQALRRLLLENRVAKVLYDLNLTEGQKAELKAILEQVKAGRDERLAEAASLLAERRDALLAGDESAVREADRKIAALTRDSVAQVRELFKPFAEGLTERQRSLVAQLIPGAVTWNRVAESRFSGRARFDNDDVRNFIERRRGVDAVPVPPHVRNFQELPGLPRMGDRVSAREPRERIMSRMMPGPGGGVRFERHLDRPGMLGAALRAQSIDILLDLLD